MQNYLCMLCKKTDLDFINICCKNGRNSVKEDMMELYGDAVQNYLLDDDLVCTNCMQVLDNAVRLKRQVYEIIVDHSISREYGRPGSKVFNLSSVWKVRLASSTPNYAAYDSDGETNNLLMVTRSVPYDQRSEIDIDVINGRYRGRDTPALDREVQAATSKSKRKRRARGHNWARRKRSRSQPTNAIRYDHNESRSSQPTIQGRSSRATNVSKLSRQTTGTKKEQVFIQSKELQLKRILNDIMCNDSAVKQFTRIYLNRSNGEINECDLLLAEASKQPVIKTRYATGLRCNFLNELEQAMYQCTDKSCQIIMYSLEELTEHRVKVHNEMALFLCEQCKHSYLTQEHLEKHKDLHNKRFIAYCIYCSEEFTNKRYYEEHLNEHLVHSFPCIYCDKFFLKRQLCENHVRSQHRGKKRKIKKIKPQSILDRIDKNTETSGALTKSNATNVNQNEFLVKIMCQGGRQVNSNRTLSDEDDEDTNNTNLNLENTNRNMLDLNK